LSTEQDCSINAVAIDAINTDANYYAKVFADESEQCQLICSLFINQKYPRKTYKEISGRLLGLNVFCPSVQ